MQASRRRAQPLLGVPSSPAAGPDGGSSYLMPDTRPEARPGSHHDDWAATPQAAPQSLEKTPPRARMVAPRDQNAGNDAVRIRPGDRAGTGRLARLPSRWPTWTAGGRRRPRSPGTRRTSRLAGP